MRLDRRLLVNLITVLLLGVLTVGWVLLRLVNNGVVDSYTVTVDFAGSGGVYTNQEVTYRGVSIGKVGPLTLNEDGVNVELVIDARYENEIPVNSVATVQSKSAVGEQFVNLTPASPSGPMLSDGDTIPRDQTSLPVEFQELLGSLDEVVGDVPPGKTRRLVTTLADGLTGRADDIGTILESVGKLADSFASVAPEQQRLLSNATRAGAEFLRTKEDFAAAIQAADEVLAGLGDEPEETKAFLRANDLLAREGIDLLARRGDDLAGGIRALADFMDFQLRERRTIERSLTVVPQFLKAIEDASVPWESPDGRRFYRIRTGLVYDNVPASWPCKYQVPETYPRFPHQREPREPHTRLKCAPSQEVSETLRTSLTEALVAWADENTDLVSGVSGDPGLMSSDVTGVVDSPGFMWPLDGAVTSGFGPRGGRLHEGIDIDGVTGEPIAAAAAGEVVLAASYAGFGNAVVIDHGEGVRTLYAHLSAFAARAGDEVAKGQVIGAVGCSGHCFGDHLHFEILIAGVPVDPLLYLPGGPLFVTGGGSDPHAEPLSVGGDTAGAPGAAPSP